MPKHYNLAAMTTATTGTGTITLGSALSGFLTFAQAGVQNGDVVAYIISDGAASEVGTGTYTSAGTTLTRTVLKSTNSDSAINLSGSAEVLISPSAADITPPATAAEVEAGSSATAAVTPSLQQRHPSAAKAWAEITYSGGTPSTTASYNVASLTDTGTGDVRVNLTTAFSAATYACCPISQSTSFVTSGFSNTASIMEAFSVDYNTGSLGDANISIVGYGDQ